MPFMVRQHHHDKFAGLLKQSEIVAVADLAVKDGLVADGGVIDVAEPVGDAVVLREVEERIEIVFALLAEILLHALHEVETGLVVRLRPLDLDRQRPHEHAVGLRVALVGPSVRAHGEQPLVRAGEGGGRVAEGGHHERVGRNAVRPGPRRKLVNGQLGVENRPFAKRRARVVRLRVALDSALALRSAEAVLEPGLRLGIGRRRLGFRRLLDLVEDRQFFGLGIATGITGRDFRVEIQARSPVEDEMVHLVLQPVVNEGGADERTMFEVERLDEFVRRTRREPQRSVVGDAHHRTVLAGGERRGIDRMRGDGVDERLPDAVTIDSLRQPEDQQYIILERGHVLDHVEVNAELRIVESEFLHFLASKWFKPDIYLISTVTLKKL